MWMRTLKKDCIVDVQTGRSVTAYESKNKKWYISVLTDGVSDGEPIKFQKTLRSFDTKEEAFNFLKDLQRDLNKIHYHLEPNNL